MIRKNSDERGTVLLGVLLTVLILTLLGLVSMNLATQEVLQISTNKNEAAARHLAEAGADLVVRWFHDPTFNSCRCAAFRCEAIRSSRHWFIFL